MPIADYVVGRSLATRQEAYEAEVRQLVEAAYAVIARSGSLDPPIRAILAEAELSNPAFYRHFRSKDELLLVMLDEGRGRLADYLDRRTTAQLHTEGRVAEWIRGVLAQAADPEAARRTRPFVTQVERLHARFPEQQVASEQQLVDQLAGLLGPHAHWARTLYTLVFAELERHLREDAAPSGDDVDALVAFSLSAIQAEPPAQQRGR